MGALTGGRRGESRSHLFCDDGGGETVWDEVNVEGWGGGPERWMSVERHSKEPQVAHCSPAAAPASPPPSSSLPGNRTPLKASARVIQREEGEVDVWVCVCVCVLRHKEGLFTVHIHKFGPILPSPPLLHPPCWCYLEAPIHKNTRF